MNKQEILEKAQKEGNDEMEIQTKDKSIKWTYIALIMLAVSILSTIRFFMRH